MFTMSRWRDAVEEFKHQAGRDVYVDKCLSSSYQLVEEDLNKLTAQLDQTSKERDALRRVQPLLKPFQVVEELALIIAPTSPEVGIIIWGSLTILTMVRFPTGD